METFSTMKANSESLDSKAAFFMCLESVFTVGCRLASDFGQIRWIKKKKAWKFY